jgi:hypothetical protein
MARVDEIVDGIYRMSTTFHLDDYDFQFNQFLIDDERRALIHTGMYPMYDDMRAAVGEVVDPGEARLHGPLALRGRRVRRHGSLPRRCARLDLGVLRSQRAVEPQRINRALRLASAPPRAGGRRESEEVANRCFALKAALARPRYCADNVFRIAVGIRPVSAPARPGRQDLSVARKASGRLGGIASSRIAHPSSG